MFQRSLTAFIFFFFLLFTNNQIAQACSCGPKSSVLEAFQNADKVIVAQGKSLGAMVDKPDPREIPIMKFTVEKAYKGEVQVGDEIILYAKAWACGWNFNETNIGQRFLFYLHSNKITEAMVVGQCGRSQYLEHASEDLLFLDNLSKMRGMTRISGVVEFEKDGEASVAGIKITIISAKKSYQVTSDENGVYEIYDLPPGKYWIKPYIPEGWKIDKYSLSKTDSEDYVGKEEADYDKRRGIPIILKAKKHARMNIYFEIDNAIRGKVFDPEGKPMVDVCVHAFSINSESMKDGEIGCTDKDGSFSIEELLPSNYFLVANPDGILSSTEPFKALFFPGTTERKKATPISIQIGQFVENVILNVPKVESITTINGRFIYSDGKPVINEEVVLEVENKTTEIEEKFRANTDEMGKFSLKILKGLKGRLMGRMYTYSGKYDECPILEKLILDSGERNFEATTQVIPLNADNNIYGLELKFPFPSCKIAK